MNKRRVSPLLPALAACAGLAGCGDPPNSSKMKNNFPELQTADVTINAAHTYHVWLAATPAQRERGLMNVTEDELPTDRGMLFVFDQDLVLSFWMRNTIIPLDIAYIRSDGTIVKTYTMEPLDESGYSSLEPARFALEVRGGQFAEKNIRAGDHVSIPPDLLNPTP